MGYLVNSVIGASGGWFMGQLGKGSGFGDTGNILSGVIGGNALPAALGGLLGIAVTTGSGAGNIGSWIASAAGSALLPWIVGIFNKKI